MANRTFGKTRVNLRFSLSMAVGVAFAQPLSAVGQMGSHCGARRFHILIGDGVVNALVFLIDPSEVVLPLGVGAQDATDASARNTSKKVGASSHKNQTQGNGQ